MNTNKRQAHRDTVRTDGDGGTSPAFWLILALSLTAAAGVVVWAVEQAGGG